MHRSRFAALWFVALILVAPLAGAAWTSPNSWTETVLYSFPKPFADQSGIIQGPNGEFYGTSFGQTFPTAVPGGTVYRLNPPLPGQTAWTQTILHTFGSGSDGAWPEGGLLLDKSGALYGTTYYGGTGTCDCGVVYKLTPPVPGQTVWTETTLHSFIFTDGHGPTSPLVADAQGNLYGTAIGGGANNQGTVFELSPPRGGTGAWVFTLLHSFLGYPYVDGAWPLGITLGANGVIYGTTMQGGYGSNGVIYALVPPVSPGGSWTEHVLYIFLGRSDGYTPNGNLVIDKAGALYGTTYHGGNSQGTVFKLAPPAPGKSAWTKTILHAFGPDEAGYPLSGLTMYPGGVLFGTGSWRGPAGQGVAFIFEPPTAARPAWKYGFIHYFGAAGDGASPRTQLTVGLNGILYGTTHYGGPNSVGTIFGLAHH